jgi:hypothetical protein
LPGTGSKDYGDKPATAREMAKRHMYTSLSPPAPTDHLAVLIVVAIAIFAMIRVMQFRRIDAKIMAICFGSPLAIGLYYLLSRLFRTLAAGFAERAGR